jgi:fermentation-respiration switch protein FrsA (DUF1100 family)
MRRSFLVVLLASGLALGALPAASGAAQSPRGLPSFYQVPKTWPSKAPGTYLKSESVPVVGINGETWRIMYVSQANKSKPVAVTGYVVVPSGTAPVGGWPVVAWSHGTNGMADPCAPSLAIGQSDIPDSIINEFLAQGWAFVASDYQGEGTPGLMPYIVGDSAAMDTINIVRAAEHLPGADTSSTWVDWGHSEGGQTAMFVDHIAPKYAPDLTLKGVVAGAPPSQFKYIDGFLKTSPYAFYLLMVAYGFNAYYGNSAAPLNKVLTEAGEKLIADVTTRVHTASQCTSILAAAVAKYVKAKEFSKIQIADPFTVSKWKRLLVENDPGAFTSKSSVPLLIIQGGADEQIPVPTTLLLYKHLCSLGQITQRWIYPGQSHAGVIAPSFADMLHWIADRFAGGPNPDPYVPVGEPGIVPTAQTCN